MRSAVAKGRIGRSSVSSPEPPSFADESPRLRLAKPAAGILIPRMESSCSNNWDSVELRHLSSRLPTFPTMDSRGSSSPLVHLPFPRWGPAVNVPTAAVPRGLPFRGGRHRGSRRTARGRCRGRRPGGRRSRPSSGRGGRGGRPSPRRRLSWSATFLTACGSCSRSYSSSAGRLANARRKAFGEARSSRRSRIRSLVGERVDVAERADRVDQHRVAGRPAVGAEVADVEVVARADRAARVAQVALRGRWRAARARGRPRRAPCGRRPSRSAGRAGSGRSSPAGGFRPGGLEERRGQVGDG